MFRHEFIIVIQNITFSDLISKYTSHVFSSQSSSVYR
nr:MAG TPA: hypothetical protein [Caudoviricetes sp.]